MKKRKNIFIPIVGLRNSVERDDASKNVLFDVDGSVYTRPGLTEIIWPNDPRRLWPIDMGNLNWSFSTVPLKTKDGIDIFAFEVEITGEYEVTVTYEDPTGGEFTEPFVTEPPPALGLDPLRFRFNPDGSNTPGLEAHFFLPPASRGSAYVVSLSNALTGGVPPYRIWIPRDEYMRGFGSFEVLSEMNSIHRFGLWWLEVGGVLNNSAWNWIHKKKIITLMATDSEDSAVAESVTIDSDPRAPYFLNDSGERLGQDEAIQLNLFTGMPFDYQFKYGGGVPGIRIYHIIASLTSHEDLGIEGMSLDKSTGVYSGIPVGPRPYAYDNKPLIRLEDFWTGPNTLDGSTLKVTAHVQINLLTSPPLWAKWEPWTPESGPPTETGFMVPSPTYIRLVYGGGRENPTYFVSVDGIKWESSRSNSIYYLNSSLEWAPPTVFVTDGVSIVRVDNPASMWRDDATPPDPDFIISPFRPKNPEEEAPRVIPPFPGLTATVGISYSDFLYVSNGVLTVVELPAWMSFTTQAFDDAVRGVMTGTPTAPGDFWIRVRATNQVDSVLIELPIAVQAAPAGSVKKSVTMTSNSDPAPYSVIPGGDWDYRMFDGDDSTSIGAGFGATTGAVIFSFGPDPGDKVICNKFRIKTVSGNGPNSYRILGDGNELKTGNLADTEGWQEVDFSNSTQYLEYSFEWLSTFAGGGFGPSAYEMEWWGPE